MGLWHCGQALLAAGVTLWVERRNVVREWDCFCLGTAIDASD